MKSIIPSIFGFDVDFLKSEIEDILKSGEVNFFHFDVFDQNFGGKNFNGLNSLEKIYPLLKKYKVGADIHLVSENPLDYCQKLVQKKYEIPLRVSMHVESKETTEAFLTFTKQHNIIAGLACKLATSVDVFKNSLINFDFIHLIANDEDAGLGQFQESVLEKSKKLSKIFPDKPITLDCGIKGEHIKKGKESGVTYFIMGSAIFKSPNSLEAIIDFNRR